jgi:type III secretory pathway lipoprotein EscJ
MPSQHETPMIARRHSVKPLVLLAGLALMGLAGCDARVPLVQVLSQNEANRIVVQLADRGIDEPKISRVTIGRETGWEVQVKASQEMRSRQILNDQNLPSPSRWDLETMVKDPPMIPTKSDERARMMLAKAGEISSHFHKMYDEIVDASVVVVLPDKQRIQRSRGDETRPTATVTLKYVPRYKRVRKLVPADQLPGYNGQTDEPAERSSKKDASADEASAEGGTDPDPAESTKPSQADPPGEPSGESTSAGSGLFNSSDRDTSRRAVYASNEDSAKTSQTQSEQATESQKKAQSTKPGATPEGEAQAADRAANDPGKAMKLIYDSEELPPPLTEEKVQRMVSTAIEDLRPEDVTVSFAKAMGPTTGPPEPIIVADQETIEAEVKKKTSRYENLLVALVIVSACLALGTIVLGALYVHEKLSKAKKPLGPRGAVPAVRGR